MLVMLSFILLACLLAPEVRGQTSGSIRLVGEDGALSSRLTAGRLEVYYSGQWGTVCDDSFGSNDARVACRQLGFSNYITYGSVSTRFDAASSSTRTWLDNLSCFGSESSLGQCRHNGIGVENCDHTEDVYVSCLGDGALRLVGSFSTSSAGRLEVYYSGQWGTVCDDSFGQTDANVACRQLGYESASNYGTVSSLGYSQGSGITWLDELRCTSSDNMLSSCTHNGFGNEDCTHSEDVAVSCSTSSITIPGFETTVNFLTTGAIVGIVIGVLLPIICIIVCVVIICVIVCCVAGASTSSRSRRGNVQVTTAGKPTTAAATVVTATGTAAQAPPPPYSAQTYPGQPQAAQYPPQGQAYPQAYPAQAAPYPPTAGGQGYPPPATEGYGYPQAAPYPQAQAPPQPYPDQPPPQNPGNVEMQPFPVSDAAYPPPTYPAGDPNQPPPN